MKTLYLVDANTNIVVDSESQDASTLQSKNRYSFRSYYIIDEPMHVVYGEGENKQEVDVKKGDILILFYTNQLIKNQPAVVVAKSPVWVRREKALEKAEQKEREEWAKKKAASDNAECRESC